MTGLTDCDRLGLNGRGIVDGHHQQFPSAGFFIPVIHKE